MVPRIRGGAITLFHTQYLLKHATNVKYKYWPSRKYIYVHAVQCTGTHSLYLDPNPAFQVNADRDPQIQLGK
jgi:hypothetical protein